MDENRDILPIELIKTGIDFLKYTRSISLSKGNEPIRSMILYCLIKIGDKWLPLNREYKPIGLNGYSDWVTYEKYECLMIPTEKIDLNYLSSISVQCDNNCYYIFNDSTYPRDANLKKSYIDKLGKVFKLDGDNARYS